MALAKELKKHRIELVDPAGFELSIDDLTKEDVEAFERCHADDALEYQVCPPSFAAAPR